MSVNLMSAIFETEFRDLQDDGGNTTKASTAKLVLLAMADHANDEGEGSYPSVERLCKKTALSEQTIRNTFDALRFNGIIALEGRSKYGTNNHTINTKSFPKAIGKEVPVLTLYPLDPLIGGVTPSNQSLLTPHPLDPNHPLTIIESSLSEEISTDQAFHARQEELREDIAENSLEAAVILGKPLGKSAQKIKDSLEFHTMICAELARLPFNFDGDLPKEQENFKKFLKERQKLGQELSTWVNWWMSDEWRVANPPWKLTTIKIKWLEAFKTVERPTRPEYQKFIAPQEEEFISNPKAVK